MCLGWETRERRERRPAAIPGDGSPTRLKGHFRMIATHRNGRFKSAEKSRPNAAGEVDEVAATEPEKQASNRLSNGQFAPGSSGNPKGRPRGRTLRDEIQGVLDTIDLSNKGWRLTARTVVARALVLKAMNGDVRAAALILASEPRRVVNAHPTVGPADTGRPADLVNHFMASGQLPSEEADMPGFFREVLTALQSKDNPEDVIRKLAVQVIESFGTLEDFGDAMRDCAGKSRVQGSKTA
jgi:hypothetical protein